VAQRKLEIVLSGDAKSALRAFSATEKGAKGTESALGRLTKTAVALGGTIAVGQFFRGVIEEGEEAAKVSAQTEQVIRSTGGAAKVSAGGVGELAEALSRKTGMDDEAIQSGANLLLTFTSIRNEAGRGNDVFDRAVGLAQDMSVAFGTDLSSSSIQLGKALNDPVKGISALSRAGVQFTDQQKEQIRTLVESGRALDAQKIILAELETQVGGSAAAQATSLEKLRVTYGNLQETVAARVLPVVNRLADTFSGLPEPVQLGVLALGGFSATIPTLARLAEVATRLRTNTDDAAASSGRLGTALTGLGRLTATVGVIGAVAAVADQLTDSLAGPAPRIEKVGSALLAMTSDLGNGRTDLAATTVAFEDLGETIRLLDVDDATFSVDRFFSSFTGDTPAKVQRAREAIDQVDQALAGLVTSGNAEAAERQLSALIRAYGLNDEQVVRLRQGLDDYDAALAGSSTAQELAKGPAGELAAEMSGVADETSSAEDAFKAFKDAVDAALGVFLSADEASVRLREKMRDLGTEIATGRKETETAEAHQDRLALSMIGVVQAAQSEVEALARSGAISADTRVQTDALRDRLVALRDRFPELRAQIDNYIGRLDAIPEGEATEITTPNLPASSLNIGNWHSLLGRTPPKKDTGIFTPNLPNSVSGVSTYQGVLSRTPPLKNTSFFTPNLQAASFGVGGYHGQLNILPTVKRTHFETPGLQTALDVLKRFSGALSHLPGAAGLAFKLAGALGDGPGNIAAAGKAIDRARAAATGLPVSMSSAYRSPARNRAVGGSLTSYHLDRLNPASDWVGPTWALDELARRLRSAGRFRELLWRVPNHAPGDNPHVHYAHLGGMVERNWPSIAGLRSDERPAVLQVGERVQSRREVASATIGQGGDVHLHFHGTMDGEAGRRWVLGVLAEAKRKGYVGV
jgi:hypothetical protein